LDWRGWAITALVILGGLGWLIYDYNFGHHIHANVSVRDPNNVVGSPYTATLNVHMGGPVDVRCYVAAFTSEDVPAWQDTFTLEQVDGYVTHTGTLHVISPLGTLLTAISPSASPQEDLSIQCRTI
jgi:hypothetical protein